MEPENKTEKHHESDRKKEAVLKDLLEAPVSKDEIASIKQFADTSEIKKAGGDLEDHVRDYENNPSMRGIDSGSYYHDLIFALIQIRLPEDDAKRDWDEILKHKYTVSEKLGRNIGIHVAALDFYTNIRKYINNPKIVEASEYADTASHAMTDELTKAYNRRFFDYEIERLCKYSDAFDKPFSLALIDLDHFKTYNDNNGHVSGDIALIEAVRIFHAIATPAGGSVSRYGGEEFAILFPDLNPDEVRSVMENIRRGVYDYRFVNEYTQPGGRLTLSCGISCFSSKCRTAREIIEKADKMLYRAKDNGRNRIEFCDICWRGERHHE